MFGERKIFLVKIELNPAGKMMIPIRGLQPELVVQKASPWQMDHLGLRCQVDRAQDHHLCQSFPSRKRSPNYTPLKLDLLPLAQVAPPVQPEVDQVHF